MNKFILWIYVLLNNETCDKQCNHNTKYIERLNCRTWCTRIHYEILCCVRRTTGTYTNLELSILYKRGGTPCWIWIWACVEIGCHCNGSTIGALSAFKRSCTTMLITSNSFIVGWIPTWKFARIVLESTVFEVRCSWRDHSRWRWSRTIVTYASVTLTFDNFCRSWNKVNDGRIAGRVRWCWNCNELASNGPTGTRDSHGILGYVSDFTKCQYPMGYPKHFDWVKFIRLHRIDRINRILIIGWHPHNLNIDYLSQGGGERGKGVETFL
jgi:hypothetical protein